MINKIKRLLEIERLFYLLLWFVPISIIATLINSSQTIIFVTSALAIVAIARVLGYATKEIVLRSNPTIGGLVSATFGNFIELIIAIFALREGLIRVVQASIIGSIISNILLLIGLSVFFGGIKYKYQKFNTEAIGVSSTMLIIAVVGITIPSVYTYFNPEGTQIQLLNDSVAIVMAVIYFAGLIFSLSTHKELFDASDEIKASNEKPTISRNRAILILLLATLFASFEAELLVGGIKAAAISMGITETFIGVVIIAIITNIAEKTMAINFALENKMDVSLEIGLSSAIQIALFVVPILILISQAFGYNFLLMFSMFEVIAMVFSVMIVNHLAADGRCNWLEGAQLISVYLIIAIAFFFV